MNGTDQAAPYGFSRRRRRAVLLLFLGVVVPFVPFVVHSVRYLTGRHPVYVSSVCPPPGSGKLMPTTCYGVLPGFYNWTVAPPLTLALALVVVGGLVRLTEYRQQRRGSSGGAGGSTMTPWART